jgi:hypothetical protein
VQDCAPTVEYLPAVHMEHIEADAAEYEPTAHGRHSVEYSNDLKVPAGHDVHSP